MIFYKVFNLSANCYEYYVPDATIVAENQHIKCIVGGEQEAIASSNASKELFLQQEAYKFSIAKEVVEGNNTTWMGADLENDPEDGMYQVFNTLTGLHEAVQGKSNAVARLEVIKQKFKDSGTFLNVVQVSSLPEVYPKVKFGETVGSIPVEVM